MAVALDAFARRDILFYYSTLIHFFMQYFGKNDENLKIFLFISGYLASFIEQG